MAKELLSPVWPANGSDALAVDIEYIILLLLI